MISYVIKYKLLLVGVQAAESEVDVAVMPPDSTYTLVKFGVNRSGITGIPC
jgi:hypothetical protein